jgi:hypothetical protein
MAGVVGGMLYFATGGLLESADLEELKNKPITTAPGPVGNLLRAWWKDGSAAGNVGDWYDNRDGAHSDLDTRPYPQLQRVVYTPEQIQRRQHWALQTVVRPEVTFGNSSTSAPPELGGSNVRSYYVNPRGLAFLYQHYTRNNVYIYPEHRDHDPGHNGLGDGYGDLYPTNTPYLITSQGSSGSDQPFMRALPFTLAAFRPEVKKKLIETGLLMPTMQMILRRSNRHLSGPDDYFTGKAHPSVFEGAWVDDRKMVQLAHDIRPDDIPPLVHLEVVEETETVPGRDFAELPGLTEKLCDTPSVIARVWRGYQRTRRMVVSAAKSRDLAKKPLTYRWVVLRGDPKRVAITPRNNAGTEAEIVVRYHERRPVAPGSTLESNRVDIGVFADNGVYPSAPGFVTFYSLDGEARTYDADRIIELAHGAGGVVRSFPDPAGLMAALASAPGARILALTPAQQKALSKAAKELAPIQESRKVLQEQWTEKGRERKAAKDALDKAEEQVKALEKKVDDEEGKAAWARARAERDRLQEKHKQLDREVQQIEKRARDLEQKMKRFMEGKRADLDAPPQAFLERLLARATADPNFWNGNLATLAPLHGAAPAARQRTLEQARQRLLNNGLIEKSDSLRLTLRPVRAGEGPRAERLTEYEKSLLGYFHSVALGEVLFPGLVQTRWVHNFVDQRLAVPKEWRDLFRYEGSRLLGWVRYEGGKATEFTPEGWQVLEKDDRGRPTLARTVVYKQDPLPPGRMGFNSHLLKAHSGGEQIRFEYDGEIRKVKIREKVEDNP